jgi:soluble lytic murein transglycosylase
MFTNLIKGIAVVMLLTFFTWAAGAGKAPVASTAPRPSTAACSPFKLARYSKWKDALQCARNQKNTAAYKFVLWSKYKDEDSNASFNEIIHFVSHNKHFPDLNSLIANAENNLKPADQKAALAWFKHHKPITTNGMRYYLELLDDKSNLVPNLVKKIWISSEMNGKSREEFLARYGQYISYSDNVAKLNYVLAQRKKLSSDLLQLVDEDQRELFEARVTLLNNRGNLVRVIDSVPRRLRNDPGLLYASAQWLWNKKDFESIADIILDNHDLRELKLDDWFKIRNRIAVELLQEREYKNAYKVASSHEFQDKGNYFDAEIQSGKIAYLYLHDYAAALTHFAQAANTARTSVGKARVLYWAGMSALHLKDENAANQYFQEAAKYPDNFYGQLAQIKFGKTSHTVDPMPAVSQKDLDWIQNNELVKIAHLLILDNQYGLCRKFVLAAVKKASTPTRLYLLAKLGHETNTRILSVIAGKECAHNGNFFISHSYPTLPRSKEATIDNHAFALSIARQESEFHPYAQSGKGAMGLMQLLVSTAAEVARELRLKKVTKILLCKDHQMNVRLGSHYINKLIKQYDGSYLLAAAAYNAGPTAVNKWLNNYGDPREFKRVDQVVEWIEKIPFQETRSYIQHVLSNLQIYRSMAKTKRSDVLHIHLDKDLLRHQV